MAFFGAVISLVIGIIIAAVGFSVERKCRIDPISVTFPELPKADGFWARESNLQKLEKFGVGCEGPEDVAFDKQGRAYTGCGDGWIKRINEDGAIENHTYVGGRPLGIFIAGDPEEIYVADAFQGLLKITHDGELHVLSTEADGVKINLADGLAVTSEGLVYFTDASSKFQLPEFLFDFLDGGGNGRLLVYDPSTKSTSVVKSGLGFANGVALSGNEDFLVFAESSRARLSRLWLKGEKKGTSEVFVDNLISFPDNVRYSEGNFYVGANGERDYLMDWLFRTPKVRCLAAWLTELSLVDFEAKSRKIARLVVVSEEGELLHKYEDRTGKINALTGGMKRGPYVYFSSLHGNQMGRLKVS